MPIEVPCLSSPTQQLRTQLSESVSAIENAGVPADRGLAPLRFSNRRRAMDGPIAMSGPQFRKVFTLHGPLEDLPGLAAAYIDAMFAHYP
jgi:hypothetical protein